MDDGLPKPHPSFAAHFTDPVYDDPAGEFAPFGTDEGSDLLMEWGDRKDELPGLTLDQVLDESGFGEMPDQLSAPQTDSTPGIPEPDGEVDAATIIVGAAFTILRLTGTIDAAGRKLAIRALDVLIKYYGSPAELLKQRSDLVSFAA